MTNVLVLFLGFLLLGYSNASLNPTIVPFLQSQSTTQKIEREAENTSKLKGISKIAEEDLLAALEKVYCDNEEIHESENSNSNSPVYLANNNPDEGVTLLLLDKKSSSLSAIFDLENLQHNRLFILFHSWKFHLI
ncbi:hypothetical protein [Flavobacterium capsici]|uniref:Uncharacterized protein n=1 Tax=Flavobacterium capsici TaxID=3075618 RepID=A0AA96EX73_9FLAO|nr:MULTISPECIES: hypothetical protein [unclassified Flavobacterium]WNM20109.1 hypothetical protein RN608_05375 [Flavobacterium sp. PMR2A8]WNM21499.1 hypothetical protein RN605_12545 [Flavobacterium sp. PMTSA4]